MVRFCTEDRFGGLGTRVIFAEDFKKPAYLVISIRQIYDVSATYIELVSIDILQIDRYGVPAWVFVVYITDSMRR